ERRLLERSEEILRGLVSFSAADQERIRTMLEIITGGQELDLNRFGGASDQKIVSLTTGLELDDYTYRVAGCVGEFWTQMCRAHLFPKAKLDDSQLLVNGIRFGKGLQLINILRDVPADVRRGRCYVPEELLTRHGLTPSDLLSAANEARFRPAYDVLLQRAEDHLEAGWLYTNMLPRRCARVRLACAWAILIGVKTLQKLRTSQVLAARQPIKISRAEVRRLVWRSVLFYPITPLWKNLFYSVRRPSPS
ncbi:MAG: squalene/phytoene synthase family protein, partial [Chloroflexi bacterium]|nr:squalene/phytoene synthase family protein [Chloroflexota bacterium]